MINLTPFLLFDGNCAEAMEFYQSCLAGELTITRVADTPMKHQLPPEQHRRVAHAPPEKRSHRVVGHRLVAPHANTSARQHGRHVPEWRGGQGIETNF